MTLLTTLAGPAARQVAACILPVADARNITSFPIALQQVYGTRATIVVPLTNTVTGFFQDQTGAPIARTGFLIDRASGALVTVFSSDPTTGAFTARTPNTNPVVIVLVPNVGDGRNAIVLDNIVPI